MSYKEFLDFIEAQLKMKMGKEVRICIHSVTKNNAVVLDGVSILEQGDNVSPAIYLNSFYQEYLAGESMDNILSKILGCYLKAKKIRNMDTSFYTDINKAGSRIVCRLVGREKNKRLLKEIPYRPFLNLAIVYYYLLEQREIGSAAILVRKEHLHMWGLGEEKLHKLAVKNTRRLLPWEFVSMEELMQSLLEEEIEVGKRSDVPLYVLSNKERNNGAVWMTDPLVLEKIGDRLQEDYYILPSSIHECMIVPVSSNVSEKTLTDMVREMNQTQVEPEEVLENTIYSYIRGNKSLSMISV